MINSIIKKYENGDEMSDEDLRHLLNADKEDREIIFSTARKIRKRHFLNEVFLYGFVYFSTYCRNNCNFCYYRRDNTLSPRYRKSHDEIVSTAVSLAESGVHLIDLTMGEDVYYHEHFEELEKIIEEIKSKTGLPVMVSPGVMSSVQIEKLSHSGADWYALYQETHSTDLFEKLRIEQSFELRMDCKRQALKNNMLIEEGLLTGAGGSTDHMIHSLREMQKMKLSQVRVMTFVSQKGTPMETHHNNGSAEELLTIAVMRMLFPALLIPASLDVDGLAGLEERLNAGANVITSIIPPDKGYAGVAQSTLNIADGSRTVNGIRETVNKCGLIFSTSEKYKRWVEERKRYEYSDNRM